MGVRRLAVANGPNIFQNLLVYIMQETKNERKNKKHLKNVGPIHYCEPPHAHSPGVASGTVARHLRIDVHDANDNDNA